MVDLAPTEAGVLSERDVVLEERRQVVDSRPGRPLRRGAHGGALPEPPLRPAGHRLGARDRRALTLAAAMRLLPRALCAEQRGPGCRRGCRGGRGPAAGGKALRPDPGVRSGRSAQSPAGAAAPRRSPDRDARCAGQRADAEPALSRAATADRRPERGGGACRACGAARRLAGHLGHGARARARGWARRSTPGPPTPTPALDAQTLRPLRRAEARRRPRRGGGGARRADRALHRDGPDPAQLDRIKGQVRAVRDLRARRPRGRAPAASARP